MEEMHSFLMIGQSNMAGRGELADVPQIDDPLCFMLRMGRWQPLRDPVNVDRPIFDEWHSGVGPGSGFAVSYANRHRVKTGMIPCADGGTKLCQWMPGELLFDHAVYQTKLAMRTSTLKGILWHQGESDCVHAEDVNSYVDRFLEMISALRKTLDVPDMPVVLGELHPDITDFWLDRSLLAPMNENFRRIVDMLPHSALVKTADLNLKPDGIHFDSVSQRELGRRYHEAWETID